MATMQRAMSGIDSEYETEESRPRRDVAESLLRTVDKATQSTTRISLFHILTFGSIGASIALYLAGKRRAGIFVGLWPPTFQALKSVVDKSRRQD